MTGEEISNDESDISIQIKPLNSNKLKKDENKFNYIKNNIENENNENIYKNTININKDISMNNKYFIQKNNNNLIEEISEDEEEKHDIIKINRTIQAKTNHNKNPFIHPINHKPDMIKQTKNIRVFNKLTNNNQEIKDLQFGENEVFFENKNDKMNVNEIDDDIQLSRIIKKGEEFDTLDKLTVSERSILNQIGSGIKENNTEKKNNIKKMIKLPQVKYDNKSLLLNTLYKMENEKDENYNNRYYTLNTNKN